MFLKVGEEVLSDAPCHPAGRASLKVSTEARREREWAAATIFESPQHCGAGRPSSTRPSRVATSEGESVRKLITGLVLAVSLVTVGVASVEAASGSGDHVAASSLIFDHH
jgi:hypothetical protein